ncbi:hypothetical protein [Streptomyces sp. URMC 129]|uniref:hypothetical protein n=1 Tax=Streptomyces sp. URMC 129 TaxID=3423407 RepID=UPI003F1D158D
MNADDARHVRGVLRRLGIPGVVAPENPDEPAGDWRVYDRDDPATRVDVTADALAALAKAFPAGPARGFVVT